jgi:hypothetical protein
MKREAGLGIIESLLRHVAQAQVMRQAKKQAA